MIGAVVPRVTWISVTVKVSPAVAVAACKRKELAPSPPEPSALSLPTVIAPAEVVPIAVKVEV